jgi:hypothetical protein
MLKRGVLWVLQASHKPATSQPQASQKPAPGSEQRVCLPFSQNRNCLYLEFEMTNMGLLDKLFGSKTENGIKNDHAVIVNFTYFKYDLDPLHNLEKKLEYAINEKRLGEYDGHEIAIDMTDGILYMYGANAEELFKTVKPVLEETDFTKGAMATLRFGGPGSGAKEIEVQIDN